MTHLSETLIYRSATLTIREYCCAGDGTDGGREEATSQHEIVFPRSGMYLRRDTRGEVVADPNQVLFFHRDQPYHIAHPAGGGDVSTVFVLAPEVLSDLLASETGRGVEDAALPFRFGAIRVAPTVKAGHLGLLRAAGGAAGQDGFALEERWLRLLADVLRAPPARLHTGCCRTAASRRAHEELITETKIVIGRHFREKLSLDFIGRQVHHSPYSLSRIFREHTGIPIHQYLMRVRLLHGLEALAEMRQESIGDIGVGLGFATPSHFATAFAQTFRSTPSEFRAGVKSRQVLEMGKALFQ